MRSSEHYYAHVQGEQKGPYSFPELKHLFDSGFLPEDALYWQDGMEQWQPLRDLCMSPEQKKAAARKTRKRTWNPMYVALATLTALVIGRLFVPLTIDLWRETIQHEFTAKAAYWRARDFVRTKLRERNVFVEFESFDRSQVRLDPEAGSATVDLPCTAAGSQEAKRMLWRVLLDFKPGMREWTAREVEELKNESAPSK